MGDISCIEYTTDSNYYAQALSLRERVLRLPLGLSLSFSDTQHDAEQRHWCLLDRSSMLATVSVIVESFSQWRIRQMAVDSQHQGKHLGSQLLYCVERVAVSEKVSLINMHAREDVVGFYEALNYHIVGEQFMEVGIPHLHMTKTLEN